LTFDVETSVRDHLNEWLRLLGLDRQWAVTFDVLEGPITPDRAIALNVYFKRRDGRRESHITFDAAQITNDREAEEAALHEALHLLDHGARDIHQFIARLERPLRLARKRAQGRR
jgi:hypothetical protein